MFRGQSTPPSQAVAQSPAATAPATTELTAAPSPTILRAKAEGQIVFVDDKGASNHAQIYIQNADGTNLRHLVVSAFDDQTPALSPDGRRVLFTRYTPEGASRADGGVFVINVDGTGLEKVDMEGEDPSWSPDGTQLVETRGLFDEGAQAPYNVGLWIENVDGSGAHQITLNGLRCENVCPNGAQDNGARWSRDGKRLVFVRDTYTSPEQYAIFTVALDGTDLQRVTPEGMNVGNPHWSPDGTLVAFQSPPDPIDGIEQNLFTIHPDGTGLTQLTSHLTKTNGNQAAHHPSWSPDGTMIVFSHFPGSRPDRADLYVINADGSDLHLLAPSSLNANAPEWGPLPMP
jgi:TolB protein